MLSKNTKYYFFSRKDPDSVGKMHNFFERESTFFIEQKAIIQWLHKDWVKGKIITTTINPLLAMQFKTLAKAMTFCVENNFTVPDGWDIIEHIVE